MGVITRISHDIITDMCNIRIIAWEQVHLTRLQLEFRDESKQPPLGFLRGTLNYKKMLIGTLAFGKTIILIMYTICRKLKLA
jgi:hypothetical protein